MFTDELNSSLRILIYKFPNYYITSNYSIQFTQIDQSTEIHWLILETHTAGGYAFNETVILNTITMK